MIQIYFVCCRISGTLSIGHLEHMNWSMMASMRQRIMLQISTGKVRFFRIWTRARISSSEYR